MLDLRGALRRASRARRRRSVNKNNKRNKKEKENGDKKDTEAEELSLIFRLAEEGNVQGLLDYQDRWTFQTKARTNGNANAIIEDNDNSDPQISLLHASKRVLKTTPLMVLAERGHEEAIRHVFLPEIDLSINAQDINKSSALTLAAKHNRTSIFQLLLENGADPYMGQAQNQKKSAWYWAVKHGNLKMVQELMHHGLVDVNANLFDNRSSAIIEAAKHGRIEVFVALLQDERVDIYQCDSLGKNAIDYAKCYQRSKIQDIIKNSERKIRSRANIMLGVYGSSGISEKSLVSAVKKGDMRTLVSELGVTDGNEVEVENLEQLSLVNLAKRKALKEAVIRNDTEIVRFLALTKQTAVTREIMNLAASLGYSEVLSILLKQVISTPESIGNETVSSEPEADGSEIEQETKRENITEPETEGEPLQEQEMDADDTQAESEHQELTMLEEALMVCAKEGQEEAFREVLFTYSDKLRTVIKEKCLQESCVNGRYTIVKAIIDHTPLNGWATGQTNNFVAAVKRGNFLTMKVLIMSGFDANAFIEISKRRRNHESITLWEHALAQSNTNLVKYLFTLHDRVDINAIVSLSIGSPLMAGVKLRNPKAVNMMLDQTKPWFQKLKPNIKDSEGLTALHYATQMDRHGSCLEYIKAILKHPETDLNTFSNKYSTPIQDAKFIDAASLLLDDPRLDLMMKDMYGNTPLLHMCCEGRPDQVRKLLSVNNEANVVNAQDGYGESAIMRCASMERDYVYNASVIQNWNLCAKYLLECESVNPTLQDFTGKTLFIHACNVPSLRPGILPAEGDTLELLLRYHKETGKDVGILTEDNSNATGLFKACQKENIRIVEKLLDVFSAEHIGKVNNEGASAFEIAISTGNVRLVTLFMKKGKGINVNGFSYRFTPLSRACAADRVEIADMIMNHPDFNSLNKKVGGRAAIHIAINEVGSSRILARLLEHPEIDVNTAEEETGLTPLMMACSKSLSSEKLFDLLMSRTDININAQNANGETALMIAIKDQMVYQVMKLLQNKQIDVNLKNNEQMTALHLAALFGSVGILRLLVSLSKGLKMEEVDSSGRTALQLAEAATLLNADDRTDSNVDEKKLTCFLKEHGKVSGKRIRPFAYSDI